MTEIRNVEPDILWNIGKVEIPNPIVSAPLAGISDKAYRILAREFGCGLVFTEMISEIALVYGSQKTFDIMDIDGEVQPIAVQLFGSDPDALGKAARIAVERGARIIDFNMGCPAPKIVRSGDGCALMREPDRAARAFEALVRAVDIPVTVKMRKGFSPEQVNVVQLARTMEDLGAAAITVHGRTRDQFYSGEADWDVIGEVVSMVQVPVIGNGDVQSPEDAGKIRRYTGCTGVMIGRGSFGNPWLFGQCADYLAGRPVRYPDWQERMQVARRHLRLTVGFKGEHVGVREMRKQLAWYLKGMRDAARYRDRINHISGLGEMEELLDQLAVLQPGGEEE